MFGRRIPMKKASVLIAALVFLTLGVFAQDQTPQNRPGLEPKGSDVSYARLSFVNGKIFLQRAADLDYEEATINTPITEGDRLGTMEGRAEVSIGKMKFIRLDNDSKIDFQILPRTASPLLRIRHWTGNLYLDLGTLEKEKSVEVMTSNATFYILEEGLYRIDIGEDGRAEILVFRGLAEAAGEDGSILVKKEQRLSLTQGGFNGRPTSFFASVDDAFDRWNGDRSAIVNRVYARRDLPEGLEEYQSELDENGDWMEMEPFGSVWVPRGLGSDWRPYSSGRWTWLPYSGWCWVPYESWGWSTSHYGRWHWNMGYGWYWIPMSGWGPAWVNWWGDDFYYGWAPMSYWGYPGVLYNNVYYGRGWNKDYPYDSRALTVVRKNQLQARDAGKAALNPESLRSIGRINLTNTALAVRPDPTRATRIESVDKGRVILRKDPSSASTGTDDPSAKRPADARVIRPADRPETISGKSGSDKSAPRVVERSGKGQTAPPPKPPERKIRKKDGSESMGLSPYPSSSRITRESSGQRHSSSTSVLDKFYRTFGGNSGTISPRSGTSSSSNRGTSAGPSRSAAPRSAAPSSTSRSGSSGGGSSRGGGTIRKK
jgi:hypothetical protein